MNIAQPPRAGSLTEGNLTKQEQVFSLCYDRLYDKRLKRSSSAGVYLAHSADHVDALLGSIKANGFGTFSGDVVGHAIQSVYAMYEAAQSAVLDPARVAFAPCSGFHHAGYDYAGGYCTFNGLVIAAMRLRADKHVDEVTIIDGDGHFGDGTQDIIDRMGLTWLRHVPLDYHTVGGDPAKAKAAMIDGLSYPTDLVLYQAGADAHKADPYQAGYLSDEDWHERDLLLFNTCKAKGYPVAWNLAGGYNGVKTLTLHTQTFAAALQVYESDSPRLVQGFVCGPA